jgi:hypothetical protein
MRVEVYARRTPCVDGLPTKSAKRAPPALQAASFEAERLTHSPLDSRVPAR